ncbi:putative Galactose oxidase/kelch repeat superfamily protein [Hibiscus syriacus]|uniref:Galactose oxidase/kelch repeat superfamily protein n=1 Tax=Hibiscus syriacus TaxID=106335 RepID=A0A6A3AS99_HIBSY|nr:putative Galactose oxidase/kelch repeat superfamily protein [Hibiscus syriacus]
MGGYLDFMGRLEWVNNYGKKQCRSLFWRAKAAMKKAVKSRSKRQLKFQYDPSSYALNFDDGCCHSGVGSSSIQLAGFQEYQNDIVWVYVLRVKS